MELDMNEQNLKPITSKEQARELQLKSAKKRSENIKERKLIKDRILEKMNQTDWDEMIEGLMERAKESDKAFEILRDTIGEKPRDEIQMDTSVSFVIDIEEDAD